MREELHKLFFRVKELIERIDAMAISSSTQGLSTSEWQESQWDEMHLMRLDLDDMMSSLNSINNKDFATEATLSSLEGKDFATQSTLSSIDSKDFATESTLSSLNSKFSGIANANVVNVGASSSGNVSAGSHSVSFACTGVNCTIAGQAVGDGDVLNFKAPVGYTFGAISYSTGLLSSILIIYVS